MEVESSLSTLLSHLLVAFTMEFDNEFERQMPHRTTRAGGTQSSEAPWLVSLAMWANCMRLVTADGVRVQDLRANRADKDESERHAALGLHCSRAGSSR